MIVSIDIGTSYSSLSMIGPEGKPVPVTIGEGGTAWGDKYSLPSAVFVEENGNILVGQAAMRSRLRRPECFRMEFKRNLGEDTPLLLGGRSFRVEELYTELLLHMKACVKKTTGEDIEMAYLTCPATYRKDKKERLISAAKAAGLFQVELVPEPTAAAMSYVSAGYVKDGQTLLVYDFGGGTFDAALIQYKDGAFLPLGEPLGLPRCGGIDMDRLIYQDMMKKVDPDTLAMLQKKQEHYLRFAGQLSEKAVQIKHQLSSAQTATEYMPMGWDQLEYTLTRQAFEEMIAPMIDQTIHVCEDALTSAGLKKGDLSAVVLVGGTSRVPLVQQMVQQFAGKVPVYAAPDVDLAVVQGALSYRLYKRAKASQEKQGNAQSDGMTISCKNEEKPTSKESGITILAPVKKDGKLGYIDQTGKLVIPCQWGFKSSFEVSFNEGLLKVEKDGKYGFIDKTGALVIPCLLNDAGRFSDGLAWVQRNKKRGYINRTGSVVIPPVWEYAWNFSEGLARVNKNEEWGYIDKSGKVAIPFRWSSVQDFSEGLAGVKSGIKWGYINKDGKTVIPCRWDDVWHFSDGLAKVKKDGKLGFIDKSGNLAIPCQLHNALDFTENLAGVKNGEWGFVDTSGKCVIPCQWDCVGAFSEGFASINRNGKWGFIDKSGDLVISCQWDYAGCFTEDLAMVKKGGKYGYINKAGELVIPCQWDDAGAFSKVD